MVNVFQDKTAKPSNYNKLTRNKLAIGDIFELQTEKGVAFLQCVEIPTDNSNCELIKVFYQLHTESQDLDEVVRGDFFFIRFPLRIAAFRKIVFKVGNLNLINFVAPLFYRTTHILTDDWQIVDAKTWKRETIKKLSPEHIKLSPWGVFNDTLLKELLVANWRLEKWNDNNKII